MKTLNKPRREKAYVSLIGTTQLHYRIPWVIAWWSAAFPGFGHFLLSKYLRGSLLFIWEVIINVQSKLNLAIIFSFTGQIDKAKDVLDTRWLLLYAPVFIFAIWDSYRSANDLNNLATLAFREDAPFKAFRVGAIEINYLDKRTPWNAVLWSLLMPGLGQLYLHRILMTFFILIWWIIISYNSNLLVAIHYAFWGESEKVLSVINWQWLMFIPSLYGFSVYDAYVNTVESNKLFEQEQRKYLEMEYQRKPYNLPFQEKQGDSMYIISSFEHSLKLEQAIAALSDLGISESKIVAAPLAKRDQKRKLFDTIHQTDGISLFDLGAVLGTIFMLFGVIYGFVWKIGPIWGALIGLALGFVMGVLIDLMIKSRQSSKAKQTGTVDVVLIVQCSSNQLERVEQILWQHFAIGISRLEEPHAGEVLFMGAMNRSLSRFNKDQPRMFIIDTII